MITNPKLPIKDGYVEVEIFGQRVYVATDEYKTIQEAASRSALLAFQLAAVIQRNEFLEDLIAELAVQVYSTPPNA